MPDTPDASDLAPGLTKIAAPRKRKLFDALVERDGAVCQHCGESQDLTLDHVDPDGKTVLENLQILCRPCNSSKREREEKTVRWGSTVWQFGFTMIPNKVMLEAPLSPTAFRVYVLLLHFAHRPNDEWPGQEGLARAAQCSERTIRDSVRELEKEGLLRTRRRGLGKTNVYVLLTPRAGAAQNDGSRPADSAGQELSDSAAPSMQLKKTTKKGEANASPSETAESAGELVRRTLGLDNPPAVYKVGKVYPALNALTQACGVPDGSPRVRHAVAALNGTKTIPGIRHLLWRELVKWAEENGRLPDLAEWGPMRFSEALVNQIPHRAALYRQKRPTWELTPTALRDWWMEVPLLATKGPGSGGVTSDELGSM